MEFHDVTLIILHCIKRAPAHEINMKYFISWKTVLLVSINSDTAGKIFDRGLYLYSPPFQPPKSRDKWTVDLIGRNIFGAGC